MLIEWKEEYNTGVKIIDGHHQGLVDTMNKLYDNVNDRKFSDTEEISLLIENLIKYTREHFGFEEKYFDEFNYEYTEDHKKYHDFFENKILELKSDYKKEDIKTCFALVDFLEDWFLQHITEEDRKYIKLFKENGLF